jgi:hypothetical protein
MPSAWSADLCLLGSVLLVLAGGFAVYEFGRMMRSGGEQ